jgi:hypothetical protein
MIPPERASRCPLGNYPRAADPPTLLLHRRSRLAERRLPIGQIASASALHVGPECRVRGESGHSRLGVPSSCHVGVGRWGSAGRSLGRRRRRTPRSDSSPSGRKRNAGGWRDAGTSGCPAPMPMSRLPGECARSRAVRAGCNQGAGNVDSARSTVPRSTAGIAPEVHDWTTEPQNRALRFPGTSYRGDRI